MQNYLTLNKKEEVEIKESENNKEEEKKESKELNSIDDKKA